MNLQMHVKIYLIIKVYDREKILKFIVNKNDQKIILLNQEINITKDIDNCINAYLQSIDIVPSWIQKIKNIGFEILNGELCVFYTTSIPKDYINEDILLLKDFTEIILSYNKEKNTESSIMLSKIHTSFTSYID